MSLKDTFEESAVMSKENSSAFTFLVSFVSHHELIHLSEAGFVCYKDHLQVSECNYFSAESSTKRLKFSGALLA